MTHKYTNELIYLPLGGIGEIGMNLSLYGFGPAHQRQWLMVDCGVKFPGPELPGVDLIMPDIRFIEEECKNLVGIIITHGHEDHFGALSYLWSRLRAPVYMTPFSHALFEAKQAAYGSLHEEGEKLDKITTICAGERLQLSSFDIEFIHVTHSIPEATALAIRTPLGMVVHTGDWKLDPTPVLGPPTDIKRFAALGEEGVRAVIGDSTNAIRDGESSSEKDVGIELRRIIEGAKGRVGITGFASNVARLQTIIDAAEATGRHVLIAGRAMARSLQAAKESGVISPSADFLDSESYASLPPGKVVLLMTGSQGEARSALARIANGEHRRIQFSKGDTIVFSSKTIPGNEREVLSIINKLVSRGVEVITDHERLVHVSGHPRREELRKLYECLKPQALIPVHGEAVHLAAHAKLANEMGISEVILGKNGDLIRLAPGPCKIIDEVPSGFLVKDGNAIAEPELTGVIERRRMSFCGFIAIGIALTERGEIIAEPEIELMGLPQKGANGKALDDHIYEAVIGALKSIPRPRRRDKEVVREAIRRSARSAAHTAWGKKPICKVMIMVI